MSDGQNLVFRIDFMKPIWKSKTFYVALIQALAGFLVIFETSYPEFGVIAVMKSFLDVALRVVTVMPIETEKERLN